MLEKEKQKVFFFKKNLSILFRKIKNLLGIKKPDSYLAEQYIQNQENAYRDNDDPWSNFCGPLYRILNLHYQIAAACLEENDIKVLDMGCGLGKFSKILKDQGRSVIGVDTSKTAISKAKKRYQNIKFFIGDVRFWGNRYQGKFDAVFLMDCYHRMGDQDKKHALKNVKRLLKIGGKVIIAYGLDEYLSGRKTDVYPDLYKEIFSEFKPLQVIRRQAIDFWTKTDNANRLYVGINSK